MAEDLPDMGSREAAELFIALYQAHFGPHPAARAWRSDDGIATRERRIWRDEIDRCEPRHFSQLIELMALDMRERERGGKPKVSDLRTARLKIESRYGAKASGVPREDCALCYGSGMICVPAAPPGPGRRDWVIGDPSVAVLHEMAFPCRCTAGQKQAATTFRYLPRAVSDAAWQYLQGALEAYGRQDGDTPMALRRWLVAPPDGYAPRTIMVQAIIDSLRLEAERKGQPVDAYPDLPAPATVDALRKRIARGAAGTAARTRPVRGDFAPVAEAVDATVAAEDAAERAAIQAEGRLE